MAAMREELILADRFSDPLRNYASGLGRAADATRRLAQGAGSGAEALSQAWKGAAQDVQGAAAIAARNREYVVDVQASTAQALAGSRAALAGAQNSLQMYAQSAAAAHNETNRGRMALELESQALQLTIEKYGAGSAAAMQQAQAVNQAANAVDRATLREQAHRSALAAMTTETRQATEAAARLAQQEAMGSYLNTQSAALANMAQTGTYLSNASNMAARYAQEIVQVRSSLAGLNTELTIESQRLTEIAFSQGAASEAAIAQRRVVEGLNTQVNGLTDRLGRLNPMLVQAAGGSREAARAVEEYQNGVGRASNATSGLMDKLKGLAGAYMGLRGLKEMAGLSDTMVQTRARLDLINDGSMGTDELQKMIFDSAQRSRGDYGNTADMVAKMGIMAGDAFSGPNKLGELVGFSEVLNKMYTVSGTGLAGQRAATLQLQQAMAMGVLRGQEFRSVIQQVPMLVQAIGTSLGVSTGEVKKLADEGKITADVVKNAMFNAADMVEDKFAEMPMTWGQVWTSMKNQAMIAAQPVLEAINWIANNLDRIAPIAIGAAAGVLAFAVATAIASGAMGAAAISALKFTVALLTNPITWIAIAIGILVVMIYNWAQSIGGLKVAWLTAVDIVLTWWDKLKIGFFSGVYWVQNLLDNMGLAFQTAGVAIQDFMGDMKVGVLTILQNLINGAVGIINDFIGVLNLIPGVNIGLVGQVTFATTAAAENEAAKQARGAALADAQQQLADAAAARDAAILQMQIDAANNQRSRQMGIDAERRMAEAAKSDGLDISGMAADIGNIAGDTGKIAQKVDASDEDLKYLEDVAVRRYETKVNTTNLTPTINVNVNGNADRGAADDIASAIASILAQQAASHTAVSYAEVGV